jgi:serpin B
MKHLAALTCLTPLLALSVLSAGPSLPTVPADVQTLVQGNNAFALDLQARLRQSEGNLVCSPYSISMALAMTRAGARGQTAAEMDKVLHFTLDPSRLHPTNAELIRANNGYGRPRDYQLSVVQSLWGDDTLTVNADFERLIHTDYGATLRRVRFNQKPDEARQQINHWVQNRTNDKIKDLLHKEDIDRMTRLVLVNAIYFKGAWQLPFHKAATREESFTSGGRKRKAAMMHQTNSFRYAEGEGFQALELPYEGGDLSMMILLPREKDGLKNLEQALTPAQLSNWLEKLASRRVEVALPRFKVESRFNLTQELEALGMPSAFGGGADFSGISTSEQLRISKVIHQAMVNVDEEGTEAAAATAVVMTRSGESAVAFQADHPFLFLLRDQRTGSILFLGRVTDPS